MDLWDSKREVKRSFFEMIFRITLKSSANQTRQFGTYQYLVPIDYWKENRSTNSFAITHIISNLHIAMSGCFPKIVRSPRGICPNQDPQVLKKKTAKVPEISLVHIRSQGNPRKVNWIFTVDGFSQSSSVESGGAWASQRDVFQQNLFYLLPEKKLEK